MSDVTRICLALGTNIGDRKENLREAVRQLPPQVMVSEVSRLYETAPAYVVDQPPFLNIALTAETRLSPQSLLAYLKQLEAEIGRKKNIRFGPRKIDLDIVFFGDRVVESPALTIPHPRMAERAFVLYPLADVAPDWPHPKLGRTVRELLAELPDDNGIMRIEAWQPLG